jgi:hypothetical protein
MFIESLVTYLDAPVPRVLEVLDDVVAFQTQVAHSLHQLRRIADATSHSGDVIPSYMESGFVSNLQEALAIGSEVAKFASGELYQITKNPDRKRFKSRSDLELRYEQFLASSLDIYKDIEHMTRRVIQNTHKTVLNSSTLDFRLGLRTMLRDQVEARMTLEKRIANKSGRFPVGSDPHYAQRWNGRFWAPIMRDSACDNQVSMHGYLFDVARSTCNHAIYKEVVSLGRVDGRFVKLTNFRCKKCDELFDSLDLMRADACLPE